MVSNPDQCVFSMGASEHVIFLQGINLNPSRIDGLRVIRTARTLDDMNRAARVGYRPLVVISNREESISKYCSLYQNSETGEVGEDLFVRRAPEPPWIELGTPEYYPSATVHNYAAYLIPHDLDPGERIFIEDVIEDFAGDVIFHQTQRVKSSPAIWTGRRFHFTLPEPHQILG